jgi:alkylation response protein AidB-like acyl-CoA dehydrogenase
VKLEFSVDELAFQEDVREFIAAHFPASAPFTNSQEDQNRWSQALNQRGWAAYQWPVQHGGTGWNVTQKYIWERETSMAGVPARLGGMGMFMLAPILYTYGSVEQQLRHLPGILDNSVNWCQGYSEPDAGSDLAALRTRAVRDGDSYIVDGSKTWTSYAHEADWMFCLVRTEVCERKQDGISFLLIDMRSPGVTVQPIVTIEGLHSSLNSVFFTRVRVPVENRIGEEGRGWKYAKGLLTHERTGLAYVADSLRRLQRLREFASKTPSGRGAESMMLHDPDFRRKLAEVDIELMALEITELRTLAETASGSAPGAQSSILKLKGSLVLQRITELFVECAGNAALPYDLTEKGLREEISTYLYARAAGIAGGTNEIQRNIIAKHVLHLPT